MVGREHMLSKSRGSYVSVLQSPAVFTKTMVQGPTCLANVGAGAFSTWDAVHQERSQERCGRLPKRLNYCFSVLATATNRSICE